MSTIKDHRSSIGAHILRRQSMATQKKVGFQLPPNLKSTLLEFTNGKDHKAYQELVCILRDSEVKDEDLCHLLNDAQDCISLLNQKLRLFIQVLLVVKWTHRGPAAVTAFQSFLLDLCSAHSYHTSAVLEHLIDNLCPEWMYKEQVEWPTNEPSPAEEKMFQNVHYVLKKLLKMVPMAGQLLVSSISAKYPYYSRPAIMHQAYVHNILEILKYQPKYRQDFLYLIVSKMVELDTRAPKAEIDAAEEEEEDEMDVDTEDIFPMEQDIKMKHPSANVLDFLMLTLFKLILTDCTDPVSKTTTLERCYSVYKEFQQIFEAIILPTHNTHHVQYIMWYICSLRPKLAEVYVKNLWTLVQGVHVPPVTRQSAVAYIASFLARANFVQLDFLKKVLQDMSDWIHAYISNQDGRRAVEMKLHSVFYSVCQGLFYLMCFKHKDLFRTKQNMVFLRGLNLTKVVTCSLNPLKVCLPEVVKKFVSITRAYQLVYCNSVVERNSRSSVPIVHNKNHVMHADVPSHWLETFFPFDPYKLKRSCSVIAPTYSVYQDDGTSEESSQKMDNEEDDFLQEPMSVSVNDKRFSYSSSPGFLQDHPLHSNSSPLLRQYI